MKFRINIQYPNKAAVNSMVISDWLAGILDGNVDVFVRFSSEVNGVGTYGEVMTGILEIHNKSDISAEQMHNFLAAESENLKVSSVEKL